MKRKLIVIEKSNGKKLPSKTFITPGFRLLIFNHRGGFSIYEKKINCFFHRKVSGRFGIFKGGGFFFNRKTQ